MAGKEQTVTWITGAGGLIGSHLLRSAPEDCNVIGLTRAELELTDEKAVTARFRRDKPGLVIHCAALSKSPLCEKEPDLAWKVNVEITRVLADLCSAGRLVFFSTDLVFDGKKGWYVESDSVNPLTVYARTKVAAEEIVLRNISHLVIRTTLNSGVSPSGDGGFDEVTRRGWLAGEAARLFTDEFRCPIPAIETARAVWELIEKEARGLYHVAGTERLSRWEIGRLLAARWSELKPRIEAISIKDYKGPPRSPDTSLDCGKAQSVLGRCLPAFSEWVRNHPEETRNSRNL
jgi:dTDP-4-dehydrorhamnose reductase